MTRPTRTMLVTGGAAFLGHHLVTGLVANGWEVRIFDVAPEPAWARDLGVDYRVGDVRDQSAVTDAVAGAAVVIHGAFAPPEQPIAVIQTVNVDGTRTVIAAAVATSRPRFVLVSSMIVGRHIRPHPLAPTAPVSRLVRYQQTRITAEADVARAQGLGLSVVIARPATFIGPGQVGGFALLFDSVRRGGSVPVLGAGANRYQLVDVRDLAAGLARLANSTAGGHFSFGSSGCGSVASDLGALIDHAGTGARLRRVPAAPARAALRVVELAGLAPLSDWHQRSARNDDLIVDSSRAMTELGWQAAGDNRAALIAAYDWYAAEATSGRIATTRPVPAAHRAMHRVAATVLRGGSR